MWKRNISKKGFIRIAKSNGVDAFSFIELPNYSAPTNKDNKLAQNYTIDVWDAVSVEVDLILNTNCLTKEKIKLC
jgi:hypothetical protein